VIGRTLLFGGETGLQRCDTCLECSDHVGPPGDLVEDYELALATSANAGVARPWRCAKRADDRGQSADTNGL
jgi:hypothetical protein